MTKLGYARVSTTSQFTNIQVEALKAAGCSSVRTEKVSGKSRDGRGELATILDFLRKGDVLVVHKLDRLGRSTRDCLNLVHEIHEKGTSLQVLEPAIDTSGPMGTMVLTVLGMVSEMELGFIRERQRAGIEVAKANGVYKGRKQNLDYDKVIELKESGMGATAIARELGCHSTMVYHVLKSA